MCIQHKRQWECFVVYGYQGQQHQDISLDLEQKTHMLMPATPGFAHLSNRASSWHLWAALAF